MRSSAPLRCGLAALAMLAMPGSNLRAQTATIIDVAAGCDSSTSERTNLAAQLTTAGFAVTTITTGIVPGSLAGQQQVWDIRCQTALSAGEITTYTNFLTGGGSLFLMGEYPGYAGVRDPSLVSFVSALGGGSLNLLAGQALPSQTVLAPFNQPNAVSTVTYRAVGGTTNTGTGAFVTRDASNQGGAIAFSPGTLSGAPSGTLIIVWDVNFLDGSRTAGETALSANLIAYLAAPTPIVPVPPTLVLSLVGAAGAAALALRRRRRASRQ